MLHTVKFVESLVGKLWRISYLSNTMNLTFGLL